MAWAKVRLDWSGVDGSGVDGSRVDGDGWEVREGRGAAIARESWTVRAGLGLGGLGRKESWVEATRFFLTVAGAAAGCAGLAVAQRRDRAARRASTGSDVVLTLR